MNQQQMLLLEALGNKLIDLVKSIFPDNSEFNRRPDSGEYICEINWRLGNDVNRPEKRSKTVIVKITGDALEDYRDSRSSKQQKANRSFMEFIAVKYRAFDSDHNTKPPPEEEWLVTTSILNE